MRGPSRAALAEARQRLSEAVTSAAVARTLGEELFAILGRARRGGRAAAGAERQQPPGAGPGRAGPQAVRRPGQRGHPQPVHQHVRVPVVQPRPTWPPRSRSSRSPAFAAAAERGRHLDDLEDQLFRFGRVVMGAPELRTVLSDPTIPAQYKRQLLDTLLEGKVTADSRALIGEAAEHTRGRSVDMTLDRLRAVDRAVAPAPDRGRPGGPPAHRTPARAAGRRARRRVRARDSSGRHRRSSRRGWHIGPDRG